MDAAASGIVTLPSPCPAVGGSDAPDLPGWWSSSPDGLLDDARRGREAYWPGADR